MTQPIDPLDHSWWIASRSAGVVAFVAVAVSVILGLMMANGLLRGRTRLILGLHEYTALAGLIAIAVHGITLLGDPWMNPTLTQIAIPLTIDYRPVWTSLGIIAGWLAVLLGLSFYVRKRIGARLWRQVHRATILVWVLAVAHTIGGGTDGSERWMQAIMVTTGIPIVFLFLRRTVPGDAKREAAQRASLADAGIGATSPAG